MLRFEFCKDCACSDCINTCKKCRSCDEYKDEGRSHCKEYNSKMIETAQEVPVQEQLESYLPSKVKEVKISIDIDEVNKLINENWILIRIVPQGNLVYHLGRI